MESTKQTPQESFEEAANIAKGFFAKSESNEPERAFASVFGYELLHTGGGVMVAVKKISDSHVIGVSDELTCLYEVDLGGPGYDAADLFFNAEDPWLVSDNYESV